MTLQRFVHLAAVLVLVFGAVLAKQSPDADQVNLRKHLDKIRSITDEAHNPCSNFPKFACGKFNNNSRGEDYPNDRVYLSEIADDLNRLTDIKLHSTQKAKDFLESCQQHQNPKNILKKVEIYKKPEEFKLAKALGVLKTSGVNSILKANINVLGGKKFRVILELDHELFLSSIFSERQIKQSLEFLDVPFAERANAEKKINAFIQKGKAILVNSKENAEVGHDIKTLRNFDWDEYLTELKKLPKLDDATFEFILEDVVNLQKIIDLANETDVKILRLVTALEFMSVAIDTGCDVVVDYFRLPIFAEFYRLYFKDVDKTFNLDVLNEFEKSHKTINSKLDSHKEGFGTRAQEKRKIIEDMAKILDSNKIDAEYRDVTIEKDNFYQNFLHLARFKIYRYLSKSSPKDDFAEEYLLNILNPVNRDKPLFYHFATQGLYLWQLFFRENRPKYSYDELRGCLETQQDKYKLFEFNDFDYFEYVEQFAAMKQTHLNFRRFWDQEYDSNHKLDSVFNEFKLTSDQAFFLNLAQRECSHVNDGKNIPFRIMLNLEDVSKAFNCPTGTQLNIAEKCTVW